MHISYIYIIGYIWINLSGPKIDYLEHIQDPLFPISINTSGEMGKSATSSSAMKKPAARKRPASAVKRPASKKPRTPGWKLGWSGGLEGFLHRPLSFMMHVDIAQRQGFFINSMAISISY